MNKIALITLLISLVLIGGCKKDEKSTTTNAVILTDNSVVDVDGNKYKTVKIGGQTWMAENLKTKKYSNGDVIIKVTDSVQWSGLASGAYCIYGNSSNLDQINTYGLLYNWYVVYDNRNVCPTGWHVPADAEWTVLVDYLGGEELAGGKLKEVDTTHWANPNNGATDEKGFKALPAGVRHFKGVYFDVKKGTQYWSSTMSTTVNMAWMRQIFGGNPELNRDVDDKKYGMSIRCVKD